MITIVRVQEKERIIAFILISLIAITLVSSCKATPQVIEVTRIVQQTMIVTQIIQISVTSTPVSTKTFQPFTPTPAFTKTSLPTEKVDWYQQDPKIVIVRYYTLLDLHLYEQAYDLMSSSSNNGKHDKSWEIEDLKAVYKAVKVLQVIRYNDYLKQTGATNQSFSDDWYMVIYYAEGNLAYSNGIQPETFVRVGKENGEWKIEEFSNMAYDKQP